MKSCASLLARDADVSLVENPNVSHDDAEEMYSCYGAHISTEEAGDITVQAVEAEWLRDGLDRAEIVEKLMESISDLAEDEAESLASLAQRVWDDMEAIEELLEAAASAAADGDLAATLEALRDARSTETNHGDDPSTSALASQLLAPALSASDREMLRDVAAVVGESDIISHGSIRCLYSEQGVSDIEGAEDCDEVETDTIGDDALSSKVLELADYDGALTDDQVDALRVLDRAHVSGDLADYIEADVEDELGLLDGLIAAAQALIDA